MALKPFFLLCILTYDLFGAFCSDGESQAAQPGTAPGAASGVPSFSMAQLASQLPAGAQLPGAGDAVTNGVQHHQDSDPPSEYRAGDAVRPTSRTAQLVSTKAVARPKSLPTQ